MRRGRPTAIADADSMRTLALCSRIYSGENEPAKPLTPDKFSEITCDRR